MREIKFRAWSIRFKHWADFPQEICGQDDMCLMDVLNNDDYEVNQFTGLHDKNGKEIYENDLIKVNIHVCVSGHAYTGDDEWIDVDYYAVVKFMPSKGFYGKVLRATNNIDDTEPRATKMVTIASYRTEVIGNIYENPELAGRTE